MRLHSVHSLITQLVLLLCVDSIVQSRRTVESLARLAFEHGARVNEQANCAEPKPQLVYFNEPTKVYLPRATLLHRCSDLTGCCPHATQTCHALETKTVDLYFYTVALRSGARNLLQDQNIEKVSMVNHTKCGCKSRTGVEATNVLDEL